MNDKSLNEIGLVTYISKQIYRFSGHHDLLNVKSRNTILIC